MEDIRVTYSLAMPLRITVEEGPDTPGGMPKRLGTASPVAGRATAVHAGHVTTLEPAPPDTPQDPSLPGTTTAYLHILTHTPSFDEAIEATKELAAGIRDSLSFQLQVPVHLTQIEAIDSTSPLKLGEERDLVLIPDPSGLLASLFFQGDIDFTWQVIGFSEAVLPQAAEEDSRIGLALWWYLKTLHTPYIIDEFMFLWVALEVLAPGVDIPLQPEPLVHPCQHQLTECTQCGRSLMRVTQGTRMKAILAHVGVSQEEAKDLWRVRQIMHGADRFKTLDNVRHIGSLVQILKAAVLALLKAEMGLGPNDLPVMQRTDAGHFGQIFLGGRRTVDEAFMELDAHQRTHAL